MNEPIRERVRHLFESLRPGEPALIEAAREVYAPHVRFEDPLQATSNLDAFIATTARLIQRARELSFVVHSVGGTDDEFFFTWTMVFAPRVGPRSQVDGVSHFRVEAGRVVHHRDYWDIANLLASALPGGKVALRALLRPLT